MKRLVFHDDVGHWLGHEALLADLPVKDFKPTTFQAKNEEKANKRVNLHGFRKLLHRHLCIRFFLRWIGLASNARSPLFLTLGLTAEGGLGRVSTMYEASGTIKLISDTQTFPSGFSKREFVVTTAHDKYPQDIKFEVVKDRCAMLDTLKVGQSVQVNFDIRGNEYNGKYYVNLACWKIQAGDGGGAASSPAAAGSSSGEPDPSELRNSDDFDDDIPF